MMLKNSDYIDISEEKKIKLLAYKVKGGASAWWEHIQNERGLIDKQSIII